jgi:hypothetical protein
MEGITMNDFERELLDIAVKGLKALEALTDYGQVAVGMLDIVSTRDIAVAVGILKVREKTYMNRIKQFAITK